MDNALEHCLEIRAPINIFSPDFSEGTAKAYSAGSEPGTWSLVRPCHKRSFALSAPTDHPLYDRAQKNAASLEKFLSARNHFGTFRSTTILCHPDRR
jgi:hypothetical protein